MFFMSLIIAMSVALLLSSKGFAFHRNYRGIEESLPDRNKYLAEKRLGKNIDSLIFEEAKGNGGIVKIPELCIKASLPAQTIRENLERLEQESFLYSVIDKNGNVLYVVKEFLSEENKRDFGF